MNPNDKLSIIGSDAKRTLNEACVRLRPMGLVLKTSNGWELTKESEIWLNSGDNLYLAAILCANIRFLAEILYYLDTPRKSADLKGIAVQEYGLGWKTISDINSCLVWLRQFGLVDFQEFSLLYSVTDLGRKFLNQIHVVEPGQISGQVDFDTLEEHRKKHNADYSMVVGCAFQNERLIKRAKEHGVVLLNVDDFETLIRKHLEVPIKLSLYRKLFEKAGIADISLVNDDRQYIIYLGNLMRAVMSCLIAESEDPETEGFLFERDIYRSLRDNRELDNPPTMEAISNMLQFLTSPLVGCVEKTKDGYYATGSLSDAARKFAFYSRNCFDDQ